MNYSESENWRLSCIQEELERIDLNGIGAPAGFEDEDIVTEDMLPPPPMELKHLDEEIYSKAIIKNDEIPREAIKKITGKYDSLNRQKCNTLDNKMPAKPPRALFLTREFEDLHQLNNNRNTSLDFVVFDRDKNNELLRQNTELLRQNSIRGYNAYMHSISPPNVSTCQAQHRHSVQHNMNSVQSNINSVQPIMNSVQPNNNLNPVQPNMNSVQPYINSVQPDHSVQSNINSGYPNISSGHPNINSGHPNINSGHPDINSGHSNINSGHSNINSGHPNINSGHPNNNSAQSNMKKTYSGDHFDTKKTTHPADPEHPSQPPREANELTEEDFVQIEMFFRSHNTDVYVGQCVTTMYFSITPKDAAPPHCTPQNSSRWTKIKQGVPVLVHDTGAGRRKRQLSINLSEVGTGFIQWREMINENTQYKIITPCFHTMTVADDNNRLIGLEFDDPSSATEFVYKLKTISCNFHNHNGSADDTQIPDKAKSKKKSKYKAPTKADISSPCCFTHVTNLDRSKNLKPKVKVSETHQKKSHSLPRRLSPNKLPKILHFLPNDT